MVVGEIGGATRQHKKLTEAPQMDMGRQKHGEGDDGRVKEPYRILGKERVIDEPHIVEDGVIHHLDAEPLVVEEERQIDSAAEEEPQAGKGKKEPPAFG